MAAYGGFLRILPLYLVAVTAPVSVAAANVATGLAVAAAIVVLLRDRSAADLPPRAVLWPLLALIGAYVLATLAASPLPRVWSKCGEELWLKLLLVAVPILAVRSPRHAIGAVGVTAVVGALVAIFAVWQYATAWDPVRDRDLTVVQWGIVAATGLTNHHLSYGGQLIVLICVVVTWGVAARDPGRYRLAAIPVGGLLLLALVFSFARSAQLGTAAALGLFVLLVPRRRGLALALLLVCALAVLAVPDTKEHLARIGSVSLNETRLNLWESTVRGIAARPLLGWGPGNFAELLAAHEVPGYYDARSHAHNDLLMHGANAGIAGILAALALFAGTVIVCWRAWRQGGDGAWLPLAAVFVQVGITVAGVFQVFQTDDEVEILLYFVLGCAVAVVAAGRAEADLRGSVPNDAFVQPPTLSEVDS